MPKWHASSAGTASNPTEKNRAKPEKQKGKKEGGLGEGIFALLRLRIERFRFSLIKRNTKQINFLFLLKEKMAREKIKRCRENFSVLVPPKRSGGGRKRTSLLFWIFFGKSSDFVQSSEPNKLKRHQTCVFLICDTNDDEFYHNISLHYNSTFIWSERTLWVWFISVA